MSETIIQLGMVFGLSLNAYTTVHEIPLTLKKVTN